jgi:hypothetical protein
MVRALTHLFIKIADIMKYISSPKNTKVLAMTDIGSAHAGKIRYKIIQDR